MPLELIYPDHARDPAAWAKKLDVSVEACELLIDADFIDLHCDMEVPIRVLGYDPSKRHGPYVRTPWLWWHTDYPRLREARFTGVVYDIATNWVRPTQNRLRATLANIDNAIARIGRHPDELAFVTNRKEYDVARAAGKTAMWLSLQGGNSISGDPSVLDGAVGDKVHRITLIHLTSSDLGGTNSPAGGDSGCTDSGLSFVEVCNANRVIVDLAHAGKKTFWTALDVHDTSIPPIVSHTGVEAIRPHWRNVDDDQIRAIADRGGVIGVMYQSNFLADVYISCERRFILDHLEHICDLVGDDHAAIGTDYDGWIIPPHDLPDVTDHPLLIQDMLDRGWSEDRIRKILGLNYLRVVKDVRPGQ